MLSISDTVSEKIKNKSPERLAGGYKEGQPFQKLLWTWKGVEMSQFVLPLLVSMSSIDPCSRVYRFSLPVLGNLSQLLWLRLPLKARPVLQLSLVIFYTTGERRCLASPNKDISPLSKSILTVCLHRLGGSPTLWFFHQTHDEEKEDWHLSRGLSYGPDWFDCVCISSASVDGNDFDPHASLSPLRWTLSGGKYMHFTFLFQ